MKINYYTYAILLLCFIQSCQSSEDYSDIDERLRMALEAQAIAGDASFFILPDQGDYSQIPQDPKNPITTAKVELGKNLFHETAFGTKGEFTFTKSTYSCASCHHAGAGFQSGLAQGIGEGGSGFGKQGEGRQRNTLCKPSQCDVQPIRSPSVLNGAFQELSLWNGQFGSTGANMGTEIQWTEDTPKAVNYLGFEGLETQAIAGIDVHRIAFSEEDIATFGYRAMFDEAFPTLLEEDRYSNISAGLAIAAYERTILATEAPFQQYLKGNLTALSDEEKHGALLFFGDANCVSCHTGPALNSMEFHAIGVREFNSEEVTHYNPDDPTKYGRYSFTQKEEDRYAFKVPQLYNLKGLNFYGHGATMRSIRQVVRYKNEAIPENPTIPREKLSDQFVRLNLSDLEIENLSLFIENSLFDANLERYVPELLPSGNCFPNNDVQSQIDLDCN